MRYLCKITVKIPIPLPAKNLSHPSAPLDDRSAIARSAGQGRPQAGASALPLTGASTVAGWRRCGGGSWRDIVTAFVMATMLAAVATTVPAVARTTTIERPAARDARAAHIAEAAHRFGIPEHWIGAVLRAESAGDPRAVSSAGAMCLMQIMPATWAELRARHRLGNDPFDERDNIIAGAAYLREMWDRYGNVAAMLAAYNAGPGRYDEYLSEGRPLPAETRAYVAALAPVLSGETVPSGAPSAPAIPADWRDAPLFVARFGRSSTAPAPPSNGTSSVDPTLPSPSADATDPAHDNAIFVPLSGDGARP